jgi:hypothetical protein
LSANLMQLWLTQYDRGELNADEVEATLLAEYEAKITALERKVGQLTNGTRPSQQNATPAPRERQRDLIDHHRCSVRRGCEVIKLPRSTFYYRSTVAAHSLSTDAPSSTIPLSRALGRLLPAA